VAETRVPSFPDVQTLRKGLALKGALGAPDLYPRDGFSELFDTERRLARLARVHPDGMLLFTTGMAAVGAALTAAISMATRETPLVACPPSMYSQIVSMLQQLHGCKLLYFKPGSRESVESVLYKQPDVLIVETVGNEPAVPVLDIEHLLKAARGTQTVLLLDNTLPLPTVAPLGETLPPEDLAVVIESGTKSYTLNQELAGLVYGPNLELVDRIRRYRRMAGTMPGVGSVGRIAELLPDIETFDTRNRAVFRTTAVLARYLYEAQQAGADFRVFHPALPTHANHELAMSLYPDGGSPLLYLRCDDQFELAEQLWRHPVVREHSDLGQSFAFDRARVLPDYAFPAVRISGGAETDAEALGAALKEAALSSA
jgi:cystathionine beta-lyase/cystathionine gamma-synthase